MGVHVCVCVCVSWAIWMSHAFHVPPNDDDQNLWLSYMPHCRKPMLCLCFHTVLFRRPKLQIGRSEVAWVDAETETQNRHLQHGITYKFRMHDFALFWYLSNTCALNEVEVAVADGDEDGDGDAHRANRSASLSEMRLCCHWMITLNMKSMKEVNDGDDVF